MRYPSPLWCHWSLRYGNSNSSVIIERDKNAQCTMQDKNDNSSISSSIRDDDSFISSKKRQRRSTAGVLQHSVLCLLAKRRSFVPVVVLMLCFMVVFSVRNRDIKRPTSFSLMLLEEEESSLATDDDNVDHFHTTSFATATPPLLTTTTTLPQRVFHRYIQQHSVYRLREENKTSTGHSSDNTTTAMMKRRFSVAHYACPQQAGNRLHHFVNDLMLAILTNRTVLVRYWDNDKACRQVGNPYDVDACDKKRQKQQQQQGQQSDNNGNNTSYSSPSLECDAILRPAPWMALYDDWMPQIQNEYHRQQQQRTSQSSSNNNNSNPFLAPPPPPPLITGLTIRGKAKDNFLPWSTTQRIGPSDDWPVVVFRPLVGVQRSNFAHLFFPLDSSLSSSSSPNPNQKNENKKKKKNDTVVDTLNNNTTTTLWQQQQQQQKKHVDIQTMASQLFSLGADYFFGMLFHESLHLTPDFIDSTFVLVHDAPYYQPQLQRLSDLLQQQQQQQQNDDNKTILSIALHSRHVNSLDDGSNVTHETACLAHLLLQQQSSLDEVKNNHLGENANGIAGIGTIAQDECRIFALSDRARTIFCIKAFLAKNSMALQHQCTVITAAHNVKHDGKEEGDDGNSSKDIIKGLEVEHGPFAGAGFYRDLLFASSLSSSSSSSSSFSKMAWIGHDRRSSSRLLLESLSYKNTHMLPDISLCRLPEENPETTNKKK